MPIVVQKFGGTSVASERSRAHVMDRVADAQSNGEQPVLVVSAMGRVGEPYATDTLFGLVGGAVPVLSRELDLLLSCGEVIASAVLTHALADRGVQAVALTGAQAGIITDEQFGNARILEVRAGRLHDWIHQGFVPVVAGFQGVTEQGEVTTLGRGGSDTTAVALGAALGAERVDIYTDVDGVKTADPKLVPNAATLSRIGYREAAELAHFGAKVIHPRAVEVSMLGAFPIHVRALTGAGGGTRIDGGPGTRIEALAAQRPVSGIAHIAARASVRIGLGGLKGGSRVLPLEVFERVSAARVSVDMIRVTPDEVSFIIPEAHCEETRAALETLPFVAALTPGLAKLSVVGAGMHGVPGVMARVLRALQTAGVTVLDTSDSHANISCLVREDETPSAVNALHEEFGLGHHLG